MRHDVSFAVEKRKWNGRVIEAAAATILINSDIGKVCIITVCGGRDMTRWLPLIDQIEAFATCEAARARASVAATAGCALATREGTSSCTRI